MRRKKMILDQEYHFANLEEVNVRVGEQRLLTIEHAGVSSFARDATIAFCPANIIVTNNEPMVLSDKKKYRHLPAEAVLGTKEANAIYVPRGIEAAFADLEIEAYFGPNAVVIKRITPKTFYRVPDTVRVNQVGDWNRYVERFGIPASESILAS